MIAVTERIRKDEIVRLKIVLLDRRLSFDRLDRSKKSLTF